MKDILMANSCIATVLQETITDSIIAYKLAKFFNLIEKEVEFFNKININNSKKYGELNEEGTAYKIKEEFLETFTKELEKILSTDVEIPFNKIKINSSFSIKDIKTLSLLHWVFEVEEE